MRITFLLSGVGSKPIGGFKVAYEYANALAERGHQVTVVHPSLLAQRSPGPAERVRRQVLSYAKQALLGRWRPERWFAIDPRVKLMWVPALHSAFVPPADICVATWWQTAERLAGFPAGKGRKFYLLQHLETWGGPEERVISTWRLPLEKIVIARWLETKAAELDEQAHYIPNGLDFTRFGLDVPLRERSPLSIAMLYHEAQWKGSGDGWRALTSVHERHPDLRVELFGVGPAPNLPAWAKYHRTPDQDELRRIYNRAGVFLSPSWAEGWPLPPAEAMMCGAAVVATDIGGHREYCTDGDTALLAASRAPESLAHALERLIEQPDLRLRIAASGHANIQQFTWRRAADRFESVLQDALFDTHPESTKVRL